MITREEFNEIIDSAKKRLKQPEFHKLLDSIEFTCAPYFDYVGQDDEDELIPIWIKELVQDTVAFLRTFIFYLKD